MAHQLLFITAENSRALWSAIKRYVLSFAMCPRAVIYREERGTSHANSCAGDGPERGAGAAPSARAPRLHTCCQRRDQWALFTPAPPGFILLFDFRHYLNFLPNSWAARERLKKLPM